MYYKKNEIILTIKYVQRSKIVEDNAFLEELHLLMFVSFLWQGLLVLTIFYAFEACSDI